MRRKEFYKNLGITLTALYVFDRPFFTRTYSIHTYIYARATKKELKNIGISVMFVLKLVATPVNTEDMCKIF